MSSWGRATDLLIGWKEHPVGCTATHGWGDDGSLMHGVGASDLLEQVLEVLPADEQLAQARRRYSEMELLAEQRQTRIDQLEVRVGQLEAAHATAERLRAEAGGRPE